MIKIMLFSGKKTCFLSGLCKKFNNFAILLVEFINKLFNKLLKNC